ncbi:YbaK/EbsC family protein [Pseudoroseomonas globiformis]|uniref:YbaK/EbsC family protein n=1 Tax=Teichococcus globiformis TaxID=2307229 RepID=A0ABV7FYD7_9PROT
MDQDSPPPLTAARPPETREGLLARMEAAGIGTRTVGHAAHFTAADGREVRATMPGAHSKNLFLKLRNPGPAPFLLLVLEQGRQVSVNAMTRLLGAGRGQFAEPHEMFAELGLWPGTVTPFALVNTLPGRVRVAIDRNLAEAGTAWFHPLTNTASTGIAPADLLRFLGDLGHAPEVFDPAATA